MATFYLDFEGGNDANNGTTFVNRWKTLTSGATAARIAPGDTVRIMGSPAPTSLGQNGVWTSSALQGTKNITGTTNTTPISVTCTAHGYSTGDTVVIAGVSPHFAANGTWEITVTGPNTFTLDDSIGNNTSATSGTARLRSNSRVMLTTPVTQNIASTGRARAAWVASSNCSHSFSGTIFKEHDSSDAITVNTAFVTGKAAYYTLPSTLDLSGYQQVSFWVYITFNAFTTANKCELRLCSDTTGDTVVDTLAFPTIPTVNRFQCVTINKGSALGSSISSIALYVNEDLAVAGNVIIYLSNIIACKASSEPDSLTLSSLIGKNVTGETFWGIQSINGRRVMLDSDTSAIPTSTFVRGYYGTSETVTTWKRETIKLGPTASFNTPLQTIQDNGTDGNPITFSGGWDRTNMSTQSLETWLDGVNGFGYGIDVSNRSYVATNGIALVRFVRSLSSTTNTTWCNLGLIASNNTSDTTASIVFPASSHFNTINILNCAANTGSCVSLSGRSNYFIIQNSWVSSNGGIILGSTGQFAAITGTSATSTIANMGTGAGGIDVAGVGRAIIKNLTITETPYDLLANTSAYLVILENVTLSSSTEVSGTGNSSYIIQSHNHDQTAGNHKIFMRGALISSATDQRNTASGISWKIQPTSTERSANWPISLSLAKVACAANSLVTVKAWMRRDNSGLTMRLVCKGGQIAGVANDVTASVTTTNAWEEETITFTPTETGVVEITAEAWGGTTFSGWVDDLTISQA